MKTKLHIIVLVTVFLFTGCSEDKLFFFTDPGPEKTKLIPLNQPVKDIQINGIFDITLVPDTLGYIEAKTKEKLLSKINVNHYSDSILDLSMDAYPAWQNDYEKVKLVIHLKHTSDLKRLEFQAPSTIRSSDTLHIKNILIGLVSETAEMDLTFDAHNIFFYNNMNSNGLVTLRGKTKYATIYGYNAIKINTLNLSGHAMTIYNNSYADFHIGRVNHLKLNLNSRGNIFYLPPFEKLTIQEHTGSGEFIPITKD
jgi:hypothetical protein